MSSFTAFASQNRKTLGDIPGCPGKSVVIRQLNGKRRRKAGEAAQAEYISQVQRLRGAAALKETNARQETNPEAQKKALEEAQSKLANDPLAGLDRDELLAQGIVSWDF